LYGALDVKRRFLRPCSFLFQPVLRQAGARCGTIGGELAIGRGSSRRNLVFGGSDGDPNHDAAMRIGGEAPERRAHSVTRHDSHGANRAAPPRIVIGASNAGSPKPVFWYSASGRGGHVVARRTTPSGGSPVVTKRQSAIKSLRASATIIVLRAPLAAAVLARYHCARALSF
jgi:hypothetical protein